ncbi:putative dis1-suppressing protein kinase dsk1 [Venturia nashicola]|uniref:non-specific serine/threonine protein kinase n=1 Tax=Venturia nashicola TaxID=86259 RepID=A0A4Z1PW50_9PEZI|nr:putative dis1-suppressing protein kinase dsk1 [Venturia nashicola]
MRITDFGPLSLRAPEIFLGTPWDSSIDVWGFACIIYELLYGRVLFRGRPGPKDVWTAEEDQIAQMIELFRPIPSSVQKRAIKESFKSERIEIINLTLELKNVPSPSSTAFICVAVVKVPQTLCCYSTDESIYPLSQEDWFVYDSVPISAWYVLKSPANQNGHTTCKGVQKTGSAVSLVEETPSSRLALCIFYSILRLVIEESWSKFEKRKVSGQRTINPTVYTSYSEGSQRRKTKADMCRQVSSPKHLSLRKQKLVSYHADVNRLRHPTDSPRASAVSNLYNFRSLDSNHNRSQLFSMMETAIDTTPATPDQW